MNSIDWLKRGFGDHVARIRHHDENIYRFWADRFLFRGLICSFYHMENIHPHLSVVEHAKILPIKYAFDASCAVAVARGSR